MCNNASRYSLVTLDVNLVHPLCMLLMCFRGSAGELLGDVGGATQISARGVSYRE